MESIKINKVIIIIIIIIIITRNYFFNKEFIFININFDHYYRDDFY